MRSGPNDAIVLSLFHHARSSRTRARPRSSRVKNSFGNAQRQINDAFVELQVGAQRASFLTSLLDEGFIDGTQHIEQLHVFRPMRNLLSQCRIMRERESTTRYSR